jgi:mevalonate kinase
MIRASAPGKLMLFGEHSVVYGGSCIATSLEHRYVVELEEIHNQKIVIETPESRSKKILYEINSNQILNNTKYEKPISFVQAALKSFFLQYGPIKRGLQISTNGPTANYGLGSSSAITVATIFALVNAFDINCSKREIFDLSYRAVIEVQGESSGFDVASAVFGGTIYYKNRGEIIENLHVPPSMPIVLAFTGNKVSTISYIEYVSALKNRQRHIINSVFGLIDQVVDQAKINIEEQNWWVVGELANICQGLLDSIGVNTMQILAPVYAARENGAWGAKLSGAGGGDCIFAIVDKPHKYQVESAIKKTGAEILSVKFGAEGVKLI